ncbi:MAG: antibiotic biosynthesis monooxygenase [Pseudomonadales bacterium]|nr:antibiotic biosynthesis monooxygenase [Pseudomonadales bacterium]
MAILELAILNIKPGREEDFKRAFENAKQIIMTMSGYISHELKSCLENPCRFVLLVKWEKLEDHTEGFRGSKEYQEWRKLLHHFYHPFPEVQHYTDI